MRATGNRPVWRAGCFVALRVLLVLGMPPAPAWADAPRDMSTNMRLWMDGQDISATDTGNGGGTRPVAGATLSSWRDKSPNNLTLTTWGTSLPTATSDSVSCTSTGGFNLTGGLYGTGTTVSNTDVFAVVNTRSDILSHLIWNGLGDGNRISIDLPYNNTIYWDHTVSTGRLSTNFSGTAFNTTYLWNFGAGGSSQIITRNGSSVATKNSSGSYTQLAGSIFYLCGGEGGGYDGAVSEILIFNRRLNTAEKNILQSYLAAKYANPGGAGAANRYTVAGAYRYHVGGIGQEAGSSLATGTSAGLTIANGTLLGTGTYLLAGTDSLNPATGTATSGLPAGYTSRAARTWYVTRTGTGTGTAAMTFNLAQLGLTAATGAKLALFYRSGATGAYTESVAGTYNGGGTISFTVSDPQSGYYTLGLPAPVISLSLSDTVVSDRVNDTNFKMIPGALLHTSAVATNSGNGSPDADTAVLAFPIKPNTKLFVGDLAGAGSGPVQFTQGATSSGLTYTYTSLASTTDRLDFSNDSGTTWTYVPVPDSQQADATVTNLRVRLGGTFANGVTPNFPSFTLKYGLVVK